MDILGYLKGKLDQQSKLLYEISWQNWSTDFLRFYRSQTNYNISKDSQALSMNIYKDQKSYSISMDEPSIPKVDAALEEVLALIDSLPPDPDFVDLEDDLSLAKTREQKNNIEEIPLELKTEILSKIAQAVKPFDFEIFGTFICNSSSARIINSNNMDKTSMSSPIFLEVKAVHKQSSITVLQSFGGEDFSHFDEARFTHELLEKITNCQNPVVDVEPGRYEVILAPRCVAEFVQYLAWSMTAQAYDQHNSFFETKLGKQVFPSILNIMDDPTDPSLIRQDYGSNGHIYRPLKLIEDGVFKAFICDHYYHRKTGLPKNGNTANCLSIAPGDAKLEDMIKDIKDGLYISSLHYMNFINMKQTSVTGLTRDGTFRIKDGKIVNVVNSLRFTESIDRILQNVISLEDSAHSIPFSGNYDRFAISCTKAPHARIKGFNISSSTHTI